MSTMTVRSPFGEIPWPQVSRVNDEEMKRLMIDVVDRVYRFLHLLFNERQLINEHLDVFGNVAYRE
jgi:hypothetical protein